MRTQICNFSAAFATKHAMIIHAIKWVILLILALPIIAQSQVPVSLAPVPRQQFSDQNGNPLAGGLIFTYAAGTSTPQATYTDSSGTNLNSNPIVLDAGGFATIWLSALPYKICAQNALGVQQWCVDNVTLPGLSLLSTPNTWSAPQMFGPCDIIINPGPSTLCSNATFPRTHTLPDNTGTIAENNINNFFTAIQTFGLANNQVAMGSPSGAQTILNFPIPSPVSVTLTFPSITDTILSQQSPTLITPTITGASTGTGVQGTDVKLVSGNNFGSAGSPICVDSLGGATGTGCTAGEGTLTTGANVLGNAGCSATGTGCAFYFLANPHNLTRVLVQVVRAPVGCGTNAKFGLTDVTGANVLYQVQPTITGINDSGAISIPMPAGHQYAVGVSALDSGCGTDAIAGVTVTYQ